MNALLRTLVGIFVAPAEDALDAEAAAGRDGIRSPRGAARRDHARSSRRAVVAPGTAAPGGAAWHARSLLRVLAGVFVAPAEARPRVAAPSAVAVLCAPVDAVALGGAVGTGLARESPALVLAWTGETLAPPPLLAPATRRARRLAASLEARGQPARATARLVHASLPADERAAVVAAERAMAAAGSSPTVLVIAGARGDALDDLLARQDVVLVATRPGADADLASLAVESLPAPERAVVCRPTAPGALARALASAGLCCAPSLRAAREEVGRHDRA